MIRMDERISRTNTTITSRGYAILSWGLSLIIIYRVFILGQEFSDYPDIFFLWLGTNTYVALTSSLKGVQPFGGRRHALWLVSGIIALTSTGVSVLMGTSGIQIIFTLLVSFGGSLVVLLALQGAYLWWERRNVG